MAQFLGDLAFLAELAVVAGGLTLLHRARAESSAGLLRLAGYVLVIGGIGAALCTGYYWFKYQAQGDFDRAHPVVTHEMSQAMHDRMMKMHQSIWNGMKHGQGMPSQPPQAEAGDESMEHHPE